MSQNAAEAARRPTDDTPEFLSWDQIKALTPPRWRIEGWLPTSGVGHIYGDSGTYKSTWAFQAAYCIAAGIDFCGCAVKQAPVVYIAGEDLLSFRLRALALEKHYGKSVAGKLFLRPHPTHLENSMVVEALARRILEVCPAPGAIFIDTLRTNFEGDENSSDIMNKVTSSCKLLAKITGAPVVLVHHVGKDEGRGARGSSALRCDHDIVIRAEWAADKPTGEFIREKCRGMPRAVGGFKRIVLEVDPAAEFSEGVVLEETFELTVSRPAQRKPLDAKALHVLEVLGNHFQGGPVLPRQLREACDAAVLSPQGKTRHAVYDAFSKALERLASKQLVRWEDGGVALVSR